MATASVDSAGAPAAALADDADPFVAKRAEVAGELDSVLVQLPEAREALAAATAASAAATAHLRAINLRATAALRGGSISREMREVIDDARRARHRAQAAETLARQTLENLAWRTESLRDGLAQLDRALAPPRPEADVVAMIAPRPRPVPTVDPIVFPHGRPPDDAA